MCKYVIVGNVVHEIIHFRSQPHQGVPARIEDIIKGRFPGAWPTWGDVLSELRDFWFNEFKVRFNKHFIHIMNKLFSAYVIDPRLCMWCCRSVIIGCLSMIASWGGIWKFKALNTWRTCLPTSESQEKCQIFMSPDNMEQLRKYWESPEFKKLSEQNKKNYNNDQDGVRPSQHTCGVIPVTEWHRRFVRMHSLHVLF